MKAEDNNNINFFVLLLCTEHQSTMEQAHEELETQYTNELEALQKKHEGEVKALQEFFNKELATERAKLELEKDADLERLREALSGNVSQKQQLQLQMLNEQHDRELEAVREELVQTHMEKFTEMTAQLESKHEVCCLFCKLLPRDFHERR